MTTSTIFVWDGCTSGVSSTPTTLIGAAHFALVVDVERGAAVVVVCQVVRS